MIVWNGFGGLVALVFFILTIALNSLMGKTELANRPAGIAALLTAAFAAGLGFWLKKQPTRVLIDKSTGQEVQIGRKDSLFFIPVIYWGPILAILGLILIFKP